jgi:hypothetical protein
VVGGLCLVVGDLLITPLVDDGAKSLIKIRASIATSGLYVSGDHRTQLTTYLRLNEKPVPSLYGPSADEPLP